MLYAIFLIIYKEGIQQGNQNKFYVCLTLLYVINGHTKNIKCMPKYRECNNGYIQRAHNRDPKTARIRSDLKECVPLQQKGKTL